MATAPSALTPPPAPGGDVNNPPSPAQVNPTSPPAASPAPPIQSPRMQKGLALSIQAVAALRAIAQAFPATSGKIAQINDMMREVDAQIMESAPTGEPAAPPS